MVSFCDLHGYGTPTYPDVETYWRKLELEKFDRFLIFTSRVTQDDLDAIKKVKFINKPFFLIRTHIDEDAESMMRKKKDEFKEEELLSTIRNEILKWTKSCPKENIFIIDNYDPHKWEFFQLVEAIMKVMPDAEVGKMAYVIVLRMCIVISQLLHVVSSNIFIWLLVDCTVT